MKFQTPLTGGLFQTIDGFLELANQVFAFNIGESFRLFHVYLFLQFPIEESRSAGNVWPEDSTCISWLDNQPAGSVIYAAFGSVAILSKQQFNELALGLKTCRPTILWVVRSDFTAESSAVQYRDGFIEKVNHGHGKIVSWAPQEKVLAHPAVACFLSHCGWNSIMDGVGMAVPFLCWPNFGDQFHNESCICDKWEVGLYLNSDENGFVSMHEIKKKIEKLISDDGTKSNAEKLKE